MRLATKKITLYSLALLISGCGLITSTPDKDWLTPEQHKANQQLSHWELSGKIGLRREASAHTGYINWQQCADSFDIRLTGPLGQGAAHLTGNNTSVTLQTQEATYRALSPEQLLEQHLGWSIPVSELTYWVRGIPSPYSTVTQSSEQGFKQNGWLIKYNKWQTINGYKVPKKAIATHSQLKITLILKKWHFNTTCSIEPLTTNNSL